MELVLFMPMVVEIRFSSSAVKERLMSGTLELVVNLRSTLALRANVLEKSPLESNKPPLTSLKPVLEDFKFSYGLLLNPVYATLSLVTIRPLRHVNKFSILVTNVNSLPN